MPSIDATVQAIEVAPSWVKRIAQIRLIPENHGSSDQTTIYAAIARSLYVPHLAPDYAYIHEAWFYEPPYFMEIYEVADRESNGFTNVSESDLTRIIQADPRTLLVFRTIMGLTKEEFSHATNHVAEPLGLASISANKVDSMERKRTRTSIDLAVVVAKTLAQIIDGSLFGRPTGNPHSKQTKPDTVLGWSSVHKYAAEGVPYSIFLNQRHYGGAFRQILDATSSQRGDILEDAVEALMKMNKIPYIRTGGHDQGEIASRFGITVTPAPDFVFFDSSEVLRGMLECKGINQGGTARDKADRFDTLKGEATRLSGIPLFAMLGGMGWARVNDALGPVVRATDGRVFTLATRDQLLEVPPFPSLIGTAP